ncbi:MAG: alpha-amylase family glycosyl hydrolase [Ignavibacteriaceae bacterium]
MRRKYLQMILFLALFFAAFAVQKINAQNDVMMQAFYWNVPVDTANKNGTWWDTLGIKAPSLASAGFTGMWVPPPSKGNWGITDMGYGLFDHYDLGNYNQKGSTETRFGSRTELNNMITTMHSNNIKVYADIILNHVYGDEPEREVNPAVKCYVFSEAFTNGAQHVPYPTNEITWKIPAAAAGDYYIEIAGYYLDWTLSSTQRGYDVYIDWTGATPNTSVNWESEPNNGSGNFNVFPGSGYTVRGHMDYQGDIDEYKVTLTTAHDIIIKLVARKETFDPWTWAWDDQTHGYYPKNIWYNGSNLASTTLQATTVTGIYYPIHTGVGEANYSWTYSDFHPVDCNDWLGDGGINDQIITNTKWFGNDLNTFSTTVQTRLKDWGTWLSNTVGFDGYRLDFVRGFQPDFTAAWINNLPLLDGSQRFIVAEYWTTLPDVLQGWVNTIDSYGAASSVFDFLLKNDLTRMCNLNDVDFNMAWLNHSGMVRNDGGYSLPGTRIVTFIDNHDTGKESDKWVSKDWKMAYAYILTHEGRPCVFYPQYYGVTQVDNNNPSITVTAPSSLQTDINKLIQVRKNYLGGIISVLSEVGNPYPSGDTYNVYVARRQGNGTRDGSIVVINNSNTLTKGLWVDSSPAGFSNWANTLLCNAYDYNETTQVQADGRVYVSAPPRSYKVWVKCSDYLALPKENITQQSGNQIPTEFKLAQNYPNPFNPSTTISYNIPEGKNDMVKIVVYNSLGQPVKVLVDERKSAGSYSVVWDGRNDSGNHVSSGVYFYRIIAGSYTDIRRMVLLK